MALKIRLRQQGRKNQPFYRLVLTDTRAPRDGKYHENLGWYNPVEVEPEKTLTVHAERVKHWLDHGAEMSEKAEALIARSAPAVLAEYRQRQIEKRKRACAKKKALRTSA